MRIAPEKSMLLFQMLLVFLGAAVLMTLFEVVKEWIATDEMTRWESHTITIIVAAMCATITAFFIRQWASSIESVLKENIEQLRLAASVFHNSSDGVVITNANGKIVSVNPAFTEITGYAESEVLGETPMFLRSDLLPATLFDALMSALTQEGSWQGEIWNRKKGGEAILEWMTINRITGSSGALSRYVAVFRDVTEIRRIDDGIRRQAFHDTLTGLPNRLLFLERLAHGIQRAKRDRTRLSLIFMDLDGFKAINDTHGHDVGDLVLKEVADRFDALMRRGDDTVARYGGDEFTILIEDVKESRQSVELAERIIAELSRPVIFNDLHLNVGISIGLVFYPDDGNDSKELIKAADTAMYSAKAAISGQPKAGRIHGLKGPLPATATT